jgi:hypothetical protein
MRGLIAATVAVPLAVLPWQRPRAYPPKGVTVTPELHAWFERQHNVTGGWCCNLGDGHILEPDEWRSSGSRYEVRIDGEWRQVPDSSMRDLSGGPNPVGAAVVWYSKDGKRIYCFAPGITL